MKKTLILSIATLIAFASCNEIETPAVDDEQSGMLVVNLQLPQPTKVNSQFTDALDYETAVQYIRIALYESNGRCRSFSFDKAESSPYILDDLSSGTKTIRVFVNYFIGDDEGNFLAHLPSEVKVDGFPMYGEGSVEIQRGKLTTVTIPVMRCVSRINLLSIKNDLPTSYGSIDVKCAFLINVKENWYPYNSNVEKATYETFINKHGRMDEEPQVESHKINGKPYYATYPDLTFKSLNQTIEHSETYSFPLSDKCLFYALPNDIDNPNQQPFFSTSFTPQNTRLVFLYTVTPKNEKPMDRYYGITFDSLEPNKTYDVSMKINTIGLDDPNIDGRRFSPMSDDLAVSINVSEDWEPGLAYAN